MSVTRATVTTVAKSIAQDPGGTTKLLLADGDYDTAINEAIDVFRGDRPNLRVVHHTVVTAGFRAILKGTGAILSSSGLDRWVDGASQMRDVYLGYSTTIQNNRPLDRTFWRVLKEPTVVVLELLADALAVGEVLRLEFVSPHTVDMTNVASTSILEGDVTAFETLTAAKICEMTARRYVQNTGTSTFQNETVDRRTQSDIMAARAKDLLRAYAGMVGKGAGEVTAAAAVKKLVIPTLHGRGRLWRRD